jgi:CRISPR-associated protein Csb2
MVGQPGRAIQRKGVRGPAGLRTAPPDAPALQPIPTARLWRWRLTGPRLPVERTLDVAELVRISLMRTAETLFGSHLLPADLYPQALHSVREGRARHAHAFFLPEDIDADGLLDHVAVVSPEPLGGAGFSRRTLALLSTCASFWIAGAGDVGLAPIQLAEACPWGSDQPARLWASLTPFAPPLHREPPPDLIARSLLEVGLPPPTAITPLGDATRPGSRNVRARDFAPNGKDAAERFRRDCPRPLELAYWSIAFDAPVSGPIVLGALAHFGLGRFASAGE